VNAGPDLLTPIVDRFRKSAGAIQQNTSVSGLLAWHIACSAESSAAPNALPRRNPNSYIERGPIVNRRVAPFVVLGVALSVAPTWADARSDARAQVNFGINVAQRGLWREAIYRWEKAVELDPTYAAAFNDLAIAYEHEGQLDKARKAYEKALELDPNNTEIKQNFELFKEINDRTGSAKQQE
jgi:tetratricopeptide (TPR) repeat protein